MAEDRVILVTGFEPFAAHTINPSEGLAKAVDGRRVGDFGIVGMVLPVHHADATGRLAVALAETRPAAVVHLGLAGGRARVALERVAVNVMDYEQPDNAGFRASGAPCIPGGPTAYFSTVPLAAMLKALVEEGIRRTSRTPRGRISATRRSTGRSTPCARGLARPASASSISRSFRRWSPPRDWSSPAWTF